MNSIVSNPAPVAPITTQKEWADSGAQYQELAWKDFVITRRLANNAPADAEHLPTKVEQFGKLVWRFNKEGRATMTYLREYGDEPVLVFTSRYSLFEVLFVADIPKMSPIKVKGENVFIPVRPITDIALCKRAMSEDLNREPMYTGAEKNALHEYDKAESAARTQKAEAQRQAQIEALAAETAKKEQDRVNRVSRIMSRKEIACYTSDGGNHRHGRPVVGNEWECLKNNMFCILVASYDDKSGTHGSLIECFRVAKSGSKVKKQHVEAVQLQLMNTKRPTEVPAEIEAEDVGQFKVVNKMLSVPIYTGVKPSLIKIAQPFAIRDKTVTTLYSRESGSLRSIGIVRHEASTT